jgi:hypothetical protein
MLSRQQSRPKRLINAVGLVFVLLFAIVTIAEASHSHDGRSPDSYKNCSVCASAHLASTAAVSAGPQAAPAASSSILILHRPLCRAVSPEKGPLFVRPPPAV